jgi:hypothetical protein
MEYKAPAKLVFILATATLTHPTAAFACPPPLVDQPQPPMPPTPPPVAVGFVQAQKPQWLNFAGSNAPYNRAEASRLRDQAARLLVEAAQQDTWAEARLAEETRLAIEQKALWDNADTVLLARLIKVTEGDNSGQIYKPGRAYFKPFLSVKGSRQSRAFSIEDESYSGDACFAPFYLQVHYGLNDKAAIFFFKERPLNEHNISDRMEPGEVINSVIQDSIERAAAKAGIWVE